MVLVLAIFAVALLLVLAVGLSTAVRGELLASRVGFDRAQSLFLAQAGLNAARAVLFYDDATVDTLLDDWGPEAEEPLDLPAELPAGTCRVRVYDACGRIDINTAPQEVLARLTGDASVAQAIVDWREAGNDDRYYQSLSYPYLPRGGRFQTPGELLLVKGVTPAMYFGGGDTPGLADLTTVVSDSADSTAEGRPRQSLNGILNQIGAAISDEQRDQWLAQIFGTALSMYQIKDLEHKLESGWDHTTPAVGFTSLAQLATLAGLSDGEIIAIIDRVTVSQRARYIVNGKVNVNTAPWEVLEALPGCTAGIAEEFVRQREREPFKSLADVVALLFAQGEGRRAFEQGLIDYLTTKSSSFYVESTGYSANGRGFRTLRALVYRLFEWNLTEPVGTPVLYQVEQDWPLPPLEEAVEPSPGNRRSRSAPS
jgi:general secretion pathway protein K